jgi:hypothetical protein
MRDLASNVKVSVGDNGDSIDLQGADSVIVVGLTDPTARVLVSDSAASGFAAPAAGTLSTVREDNGAFVVGYTGTLRYLQAGAADVVVQSHLHIAPQT